MVHVKWLIALVASVAMSIAVTQYFTEHYVTEGAIAQLSEIAIMRTGTYVNLIKTIDDGKPEEVRKKLEKMWQMEVDTIKHHQQMLAKGYFKDVNSEYIARMDRYLLEPASPRK